jgi:hypothetical protein
MLGLLLPLASLFGLEADALLDQLKRNAVAYAAALVFGLIGMVFLLVAANVALSVVLGPIWAPLALAGLAIALALAIFLSLRIRVAAEKRQRAQKRRSTETTALVTTAALTALPMLFGSHFLRNAAPPAAALAIIGLVIKAALGDDKEDDTPDSTA